MGEWVDPRQGSWGSVLLPPPPREPCRVPQAAPGIQAPALQVFGGHRSWPLEVGGRELSTTAAQERRGDVGCSQQPCEIRTGLSHNLQEGKLRYREAMPRVTQPRRATYRLPPGLSWSFTF